MLYFAANCTLYIILIIQEELGSYFMGEMGALNPLEGPQNIYKAAAAPMPPTVFHLYSYWKLEFQL